MAADAAGKFLGFARPWEQRTENRSGGVFRRVRDGFAEPLLIWFRDFPNSAAETEGVASGAMGPDPAVLEFLEEFEILFFKIDLPRGAHGLERFMLLPLD